METAVLGRTGFRIGRLCVGCMQASGFDSSDKGRFIATVQRGLDAGLNMLDTAPMYGDGYSEEVVGDAIAGRRDKVILSTKFMHREKGDARRSLEESLKRLKTDYVDLYQQHWPWPAPPLSDTLDELLELKREGKARAIGVSNWMEPEWEEAGARAAEVETLQPCHNLLWRSIERNVLPRCRKLNIAVIPYSSLCQGVLNGRFRRLEDLPSDWHRQNNVRLKPDVFPKVLETLDVLAKVAGKYGKTMGQTALRWLLDQDGIAAPIVGSSRPEQLEENLGALGWRLDRADWKLLSDASWPLSADLKPYDGLWGWHPKLL